MFRLLIQFVVRIDCLFVFRSIVLQPWRNSNLRKQTTRLAISREGLTSREQIVDKKNGIDFRFKT